MRAMVVVSSTGGGAAGSSEGASRVVTMASPTAAAATTPASAAVQLRAGADVNWLTALCWSKAMRAKSRRSTFSQRMDAASSTQSRSASRTIRSNASLIALPPRPRLSKPTTSQRATAPREHRPRSLHDAAKRRVRTVRTGAPTILAISPGAHPLELVEDEDDALLVGEPIEQTRESPHALPSLGILVGQNVEAQSQRVRGRLFGQDRAAPRRAAVHEDDVDRDAMQPRGELRLPAKVLQALVHLNEYLLDHVLEVAPRADHPIDEARDVLAMALVNLPEGARIPAGGVGDELFLVGRATVHRGPGARNVREAGQLPDHRALHDRGTHSALVRCTFAAAIQEGAADVRGDCRPFPLRSDGDSGNRASRTQRARRRRRLQREACG